MARKEDEDSLAQMGQIQSVQCPDLDKRLLYDQNCNNGNWNERVMIATREEWTYRPSKLLTSNFEKVLLPVPFGPCTTATTGSRLCVSSKSFFSAADS